MKNFKLLLGATAILSTGLAMVANAKNTEDVDVTVEFVHDSTLEKVQDMDFGKIALQQDQQHHYISGSVTISPEGEVTASNMSYYGGAKQPIFTVWIPSGLGASLVLPDEITLENNNENTCATVNGFNSGDVLYGNSCGGNPCSGTGIGATLNYDATTHNASPGETCTGSFTVSIMVPEE